MLSFTNILGLHSNFVDCKSFLESNSPDILALCETNLDDSIDSGNFSVRSCVPLIQKDSSTYMHGIAIYVKEELPFAQDWSLENSADSYLCFRFVLLHSAGQILDLYCIWLSNAAPFCKNYAKLYFGPKRFEMGLNGVVVEFLGPFFHKNVPFLTIIEWSPKFLEYDLLIILLIFSLLITFFVFVHVFWFYFV